MDKKRKCSVILTLWMACVQVFAQQHVEVDGITYEIDQTTKTAEIERAKDLQGEVVIPEQIAWEGDTFTITSVGENAFFGCEGLSRIKLPKTLKRIGNSAFYGCI